MYPGVAQGMELLRAAGGRSPVSPKSRQLCRPLRRTRDDGYFGRVFARAFERKKPDPLPLLRTCAALGSEPGRTLVIGDSANDAQAARAAGCPVLLVTYGYNHGEPVRGVDADGFLDSLAEVGAWLRPACPAALP